MREFDFSQSLRGVGVVLRAELNVPLRGGRITDAFRIRAALPTIQKLSKAGARTVVIAHIGRENTDTLRPVFEAIKEMTHVPLSFAETITGASVCRAVEAQAPGEVLLLENIRRHPGETRNSESLAEILAGYGSLYVNDAFPASHRAHASIVGIPRFIPGFAGPAFMNEFNGTLPALNPPSPSLAIVGGAKFATKEPLVRTLLEKYDHVCVGGALAHDFFLAQGFEIGKSIASRAVDVSGFLEKKNLILPTDVVVRNPHGVETKNVDEVLGSDTILDIGPESLEKLKSLIMDARFVLWNGPLGNFEEGFEEGTEELARIIAKSAGESVVGGGDTIAAIEKLKLNDRFTHVSTAGGAMLQFIAEGTLPGIEALG